MIEITIDGKKIATKSGKMLIEVADEAGIHIPRFCYHKKLSVAANCRMCLVEVAKSPKTLPACATPVTDGMQVFTQSQQARDSQKAVMEFLLVNHPLDCPICDQGGECELQDLAMGYGRDVSRFSEGKRVVTDPDLGTLVATDMTRCIHCTRCVRFGQEIAGLPELGVTGRGEHARIGTYVQHSLQSEIAGNIIDLCPVGALTAKPSLFQARAWEMRQKDSISPHDCVGSHLSLHVRRQQVIRTVPREYEPLNQTWLSDRDRFSYTGLNSEQRLTTPMVKVAGQWKSVGWEEALLHVHQHFKGIQQQADPQQLGALMSPNSTTEECYLLQKYWRSLGSHHIDHRLAQLDFTDQASFPWYPGMRSYQHLNTADALLLIGSHIEAEQPVAAIRVRQAGQRGASIISLDLQHRVCRFPVTTHAVAPQALVATLAALVVAVYGQDRGSLPSALHDLVPSDAIQASAQALRAASHPMIILGAIAQQHPQASQIRYLAHHLSLALSTEVSFLTRGSNTAGAWLAGAIPHRLAGGHAVATPGLHAHAMTEPALQGYFLWDIEPEHDSAMPARTMAAIEQARWVVVANSFCTPAMRSYADVLLPLAPFSENEGTRISVDGTWQRFSPAVHPLGEAKIGWKILRVLGHLSGAEGFDYIQADEVILDLKTQLIDDFEAPPLLVDLDLTVDSQLWRHGSWPVYRIDGLVRRAEPLQHHVLTQSPAVHLNAATIARLNVQVGQMVQVVQGDHMVTLPVVLDDQMLDHSAYIAAGWDKTCGLATVTGPMIIRAAG